MYFENIKSIFFDVAGTLYGGSSMEEAYTVEMIKALSQKYEVSFEKATEIFGRRKQELSENFGLATKTKIMKSFGFSHQQISDGLASVNPGMYLRKERKLIKLVENLEKHFELGII